MDDKQSAMDFEDVNFMGKKNRLHAAKDARRKLTFINKKINDLHHQRKFAYKYSVKVKKTIHNEVNQIVKCLRTRERCLWSDVDEAFIAQDASISRELSKLQSIHGHYSALLGHSHNFKENTNFFSEIYYALAGVNLEEIPDTKPVIFTSDLQALKSMSRNYGKLTGEFLKKENSVFVADKNNVSDVASTQLREKDVCSDEDVLLTGRDYAAYKEANIEDDFQMIDMFDNMCCHDVNEDSNMYKDESPFQASTWETVSKPAVIHGNLDCSSYKGSKSSRDFNPDEEWEQILEMNKKIENFKEILKPKKEMEINLKIHNAVGQHLTMNKSEDNQNKFLILKEGEKWLHNSSSKRNFSNKERNLTSPAELIQKAFEPYLTKDNANWLSCN